MNTVTIAEAQFVDRMVNGKYSVKMPSFLAAHDNWNNWEPERFASIEQNLKRGDTLIDVGAEVGTISAIYARTVGGENMVLLEGNPDNWQNIKATWDLEGLPIPKATFCGLVSDKTEMPEGMDYSAEQSEGWPVCALTGKIWTPRSFRLIHEHAHSTQQIKLDDFVSAMTLKPAGITIDIEGAEYRALSGARETLDRFKPRVWVSVHPDLMERNYQDRPEQIFALMDELGYTKHHLATDHEMHFFFSPKP